MRTSQCKNILLKSGFWKVGVPFALFFFTITFGILGAHADGSADPFWKVAYRSIAPMFGENAFDLKSANKWTWISCLTGISLVPYAFLLVVFEIHRNLLTQIRIFLWKLRGRKFIIVCGLGWKGYELAKKELGSGTFKVVGIDVLGSSSRATELCECGMAYFEANAVAPGVLRKAYIKSAHAVYVLTGDDELNCRIAMSLADLFLKEKEEEGNPLLCYVSVENRQKRDFLEDFAAEQKTRLFIHCFNLLEQAARDIVRQNGFMDHAEQHVHCVIAGSGEMSQPLLLQCLKMLHLWPRQKRMITVICESPDEFCEQLFEEYPCLKPEKDVSSDMAQARLGIFPPVVKEGLGDKSQLRIVQMPKSNSGWLDDQFALYKHLHEGWRTNLYMCIDDGIQSLAVMKLIFKRLKSFPGNLNANCYYNYPETESDDKDTEPIELDRHDTEWTEFGGFQKTCSVSYLEEAAEGRLSKDVLNIWGNADRWLKEAAWSKESNRQAADHVFIKLALAGLTPLSSKEEIREIMGDVEIVDWKKNILYKGSMMKELAEVEHRRWCAERLLGGWLPLSNQEDKAAWIKGAQDEECGCDSTERDRYQELKKIHFRHGCLVPFEMLQPKEIELEKDYAIIGDIWRMKERGHLTTD